MRYFIATLTAKVLASTLGLTQRQVQRILANLKERNMIIRHGASKNGYWEGYARIKLDFWEKAVIDEWQRHTDFVCWIRNPSSEICRILHD